LGLEEEPEVGIKYSAHDQFVTSSTIVPAAENE